MLVSINKVALHWAQLVLAWVSMSIKQTNKQTAKLLHRPRGRSVIRGWCQEKIDGREMFWDVDVRQTEMKMLGRRMTMSSKAVMQQLEMTGCLWARKPTRYLSSQSPRSTQPGHPSRVGKMSTSKSWEANRHTMQCTTQTHPVIH